ncbi:MAG: NAD-dependent epimerase/dehydratase family protein [Paludibacteraceae bacterium]|nr:NAD-dependent epimerase/dehydratase family protein [Paludibacteraceae bacterium]
MRVLFIGGTGTISSAITRLMAAMPRFELYLLNRGTHADEVPDGVHTIQADIADEAAVARLLDGMSFDCVCDFIAFVPEQVERDFRLFHGRTQQFMYISSASAYAKPAANYIINEGTSLANPYWQYSRDKIACEEQLMCYYREQGFPITIIRPSHTYCERSVPVSVHGRMGSWQVLKRMLEGKQVIVHGDGQSLWTLTYNEDFARGFIGLIGNPHAIGEVFQIMADETLTWNQIYRTLADALGVEYRPYYVASEYIDAVAPEGYDMMGNLIGDKAVSVVFDCSKLRRAVPDFTTHVCYAEGCRRAVAHILAHPELQVPDPVFDQWCDRLIVTLEDAKAKMK